jgi:hypothetical protein
MKRLLAFAAALGALVATAALVTGSASAVRAAPLPPTHVGGVVSRIGAPLAQGAGNLVYHGGPVMTTNKTYAIYWIPGGYTVPGGYTSTIDQFFTDVAHDSGLTSNVYASDTQYSGIQYSSVFGGSFTDTSNFPASGCPIYEGDITECLTDAQIIAEVNKVTQSQGWTKNGTNMFFVFTPQAVGSCFDAQGSQGCAYTDYCAYHGHAASGAIYANQPYARHSGCDVGQYPNGSSTGADPTINVTSHEHNEAITDPQLNAWYDAVGYENGDKCAWDFGAVSGANGTEYNQTINGHHYFLQREYSNNGSQCVQTYSSGGGGGGGAPKITSFSPTSGKRGSTVTINGSNFTGATWVGLTRSMLANYKSSTWTVVSSTQITATVPSTAPAGYSKWKVTTWGGSATSSASFYVSG